MLARRGPSAASCRAAGPLLRVHLREWTHLVRNLAGEHWHTPRCSGSPNWKRPGVLSRQTEEQKVQPPPQPVHSSRPRAPGCRGSVCLGRQVPEATAPRLHLSPSWKRPGCGQQGAGARSGGWLRSAGQGWGGAPSACVGLRVLLICQSTETSKRSSRHANETKPREEDLKVRPRPTHVSLITRRPASPTQECFLFPARQPHCPGAQGPLIPQHENHTGVRPGLTCPVALPPRLPCTELPRRVSPSAAEAGLPQTFSC